MLLPEGTKIGAYEVLGLLGAGGMGEVYRARDTKLKREVAVKTLPETFIRDVERLSRFQREAEVLASLNHPNIAAIHNVEEASNGSRFLVLELVEGETLADRLSRGPIPVDETMRLATQIAEAIEAAHLKGIIHRDLKPANVKITPGGRVKVLDFGLAKIYEGGTEASLSQSPTLVSGSMPGTIIGTAAYMSPEQARGLAADAQADIWAFGCLLFEMLTGSRAVPGETIADIFAAIVKSEPDWDKLPADTPQSLRLLLRRCLQKDRSRRLRHIGDAALELQQLLTEPAVTSAPAALPARSFGWALALVILVAAAAGAVVLSSLRRPMPVSDSRVIRFAVPPPERFFKRGEPTEFALSPDGRYLVFAAEGATRNLWIRSLESDEARPLPGTDTYNSMFPFWSPDSRYVGFYRSNKLYKLAIADGRTEVICNVGGFPVSTWGTNNTIVFAVDGQLFRVSADGGEPQLISIGEPLSSARGEIYNPSFLPNGNHLLFDVRTVQGDLNGVWSLSLASGEQNRIVPSASRASYSATGHLLYIRDNKLFGYQFNPSALQVAGEPILLNRSAASNVLLSRFSVSANGILAWTRIPTEGAQVVWRDRAGKLLQTVLRSGLYRQIRLSPDSSRAAVVMVNNDGNQDIWLLEKSNGVFSRLTSASTNEGDTVWSSDGGELAYVSRGNLYRNALDTSQIKPLLESAESKWLHDWSPDGQFVVYAYDRGVYALPLAGQADPITLLESDFNKDEFRVSPNSRWIAYNSSESGRSEVYVASFPRMDRRRQVSNVGGSIPRWRNDMREMYYLRPDGMMMAVDIHPGESLETGPPRELFRVDVPVSTVLDQYDVTPDGTRFIVIENEQNAASPPINIVVNWSAELR
jgi:serine/threonine protein kinase